ncbi:LPS export ABC transporter periplasmic protein LptC [Fusobacterium sp. PH5-44]|uniref:LPS export ABC transporter periplasmic protein LptC n=1 Tax=unclassified Fusobacterium TaxID=2648384 RepID=UPI003D2242B2
MKKKIIYILIGVAVLVLGYLNYFSDENLPDGGAPVITTKTKYENDEYKVEAEKQLDYLKTKETKFEFGELIILKDKTQIKADSIRIDKNNDLELRKNIRGRSENGWKIESEQIDYNKSKDIITSEEGIKAINEEKKLSIFGEKYISDSKISYIKLEKNVKLTVGKIFAAGDKGDYDEKSQIVTMEGNIKLGGTDNNDNPVSGNIKKLSYNMEKKIVESNESFDLIYRGIKLLGERILYNDESEALEITKNVAFEASGYKIFADKIIKEEKSNIVKIYGPIFGGNVEYQMNGNEGYFDTEKKELYIYGNVKIVSKDKEELTGEQIILNDEKNTVTIVGTKERPVNYRSKDGVFTTSNLVYNFSNKDVFLNDYYKVDGTRYDSEGEKGYYNTEKKSGYVINGYVFDKVEKKKLSGNLLQLDAIEESYIGKGNVVYEDEQYILTGEEIEHNNKIGKGRIVSNYIMTLKENKVSYHGNDATYNSVTGDFIDDGLVKVKGESFETIGENLRYNSKTGIGYIESQLVFQNTKNGTRVTGEKFSFQKDSFVKITGAIVIENEQLVAKSTDGYYDLKREIIEIPNEIVITGKDGTFNGTIEKGVYKVNDGIFYGETFVGKYNEYDIESERVNYSTKDGKISLINNAHIVNRNLNGQKIYGNRLEYSTVNEIFEGHNGYTAHYSNYIVNGNNIVYNMKAGTLNGNGIEIVSDSGDTFSAEKISGLMREMRVDFINNAKAFITSQEEPTNFTGDFVRVYFKNVNKKYSPVRSEARGRVTFDQKERKANAEYIEYNIEKKILFAQNKVELYTNDKENGEIFAKGNKGTIFLNNDIATLSGKVYIKNIDLVKKVTEAYGDNGKINRKSGIVEFLGNVKIKNEEGHLTADKATYNMKTKKAKASGNVYVEYKNKK